MWLSRYFGAFVRVWVFASDQDDFPHVCGCHAFAGFQVAPGQEGFRDPDGLRTDAGAARRMGYTGKFAIHPAQIDIINETFSPDPEDVAYARRVVAAWDEAEAVGRGSLSIDGRMVDVPVVKRAQNLLAQAAAIEAVSN